MSFISTIPHANTILPMKPKVARAAKGWPRLACRLPSEGSGEPPKGRLWRPGRQQAAGQPRQWRLRNLFWFILCWRF